MKENYNYILQVEKVSKAFPGVQALKNMSLSLAGKEIHAIVGENGAGKSTLVQILTGALQRDEGEIIYKGQYLKGLDSHRTLSLGISVVHQHFALSPYLNVIENIFSGCLPHNSFGVVNWKKAKEKTAAILTELNVQIPLNLPVFQLSTSQQQMVAIARAISQKPDVLILDEPTARLSLSEVETLFKILGYLKKKGLGIIYISHILEEVLKISDRITVIKDGTKQGTVKTCDTNINKIVKMMIGYTLEKLDKREKVPGKKEEIISVKGLRKDNLFHDISFSCHKGEVLGITGLVGAKKTEIIYSIVGLDRLDDGKIFLEGKETAIHSPTEAVKLGIGFIPENRLSEGIVPKLSVRQNISLANLEGVSFMGVLKRKFETSRVSHFVEELSIKISSLAQKVENLSGGNQQKVILARWLNSQVKCLIFDQPTAGIDVGAKRHIHELIRILAEQGMGVIVVSEDIPEILNVSDRIVLMRKGKIEIIISTNKTNQHEIMEIIAS